MEKIIEMILFLGFNNVVQESKEKAKDAVKQIPDIEKSIKQVNEKIKGAETDLHGAENNAQNAKETAEDAELKYAKLASEVMYKFFHVPAVN